MRLLQLWFRRLPDSELLNKREAVRKNPKEYGFNWNAILDAF